MWLKPGSQVSVILQDGTTVSGRCRFTWAFRRVVRLVDVTVSVRGQDADAAGVMLVPWSAILMVQLQVGS